MVDVSTPAGWYHQPDKTLRYWDGTAWTEHVHHPRTSTPMVYEGIRWLGARWGRSGKPLLLQISATVFTFLAGIQLVVALRVTDDVWPMVMSGLFAFGAVTYWIEAHFAARVAREQKPQPRKPRNRKPKNWPSA